MTARCDEFATDKHQSILKSMCGSESLWRAVSVHHLTQSTSRSVHAPVGGYKPTEDSTRD